MVHPGQPPALVDLIPYTRRSYAKTLMADRDLVTASLRGHPQSSATNSTASM
jgi:hypothetical protein